MCIRDRCRRARCGPSYSSPTAWWSSSTGTSPVSYTHLDVSKRQAYYCFCTEERLEALHAEQRGHGEMTHYDGCCRDLPKEEVEKRLAAGEPYVIRQKIPREGVTGFDDMVYGCLLYTSRCV